jgi:hypothetical protein
MSGVLGAGNSGAPGHQAASAGQRRGRQPPFAQGRPGGAARGCDPRRDPAGHKLATPFITAGQPILKYGQVIGAATQDIAAGAMCTCTT